MSKLLFKNRCHIIYFKYRVNGRFNETNSDLMQFKIRLINSGISIKTNNLDILCPGKYIITYEPISKTLSVVISTW